MDSATRNESIRVVLFVGDSAQVARAAAALLGSEVFDYQRELEESRSASDVTQVAETLGEWVRQHSFASPSPIVLASGVVDETRFGQKTLPFDMSKLMDLLPFALVVVRERVQDPQRSGYVAATLAMANDCPTFHHTQDEGLDSLVSWLRAPRADSSPSDDTAMRFP